VPAVRINRSKHSRLGSNVLRQLLLVLRTAGGGVGRKGPAANNITTGMPGRANGFCSPASGWENLDEPKPFLCRLCRLCRSGFIHSPHSGNVAVDPLVHDRAMPPQLRDPGPARLQRSQARYRDNAFIALDVVPALPGGTTTMTLRAINQQGVEFDRVVFSRKAGLSHGLRASRLSRRRGGVAILQGGWRPSGLVVPGRRALTLLLLRRAPRGTAHYPDD